MTSASIEFNLCSNYTSIEIYQFPRLSSFLYNTRAYTHLMIHENFPDSIDYNI